MAFSDQHAAMLTAWLVELALKFGEMLSATGDNVLKDTVLQNLFGKDVGEDDEETEDGSMMV